MTLLLDLLPPAGRRAGERMIAVLVLLLSVYLAYGGWGYFYETMDTVSPALGYPMGYLYAAAPAFAVLMAVFSCERLVNAGQGLDE
jgi:TRAP-type C4-dicarboxylate transport system permease small subunit